MYVLIVPRNIYAVLDTRTDAEHCPGALSSAPALCASSGATYRETPPLFCRGWSAWWHAAARNKKQATCKTLAGAG